jgi:DNA-binding MarR family transcriptional regulator
VNNSVANVAGSQDPAPGGREQGEQPPPVATPPDPPDPLGRPGRPGRNEQIEAVRALARASRVLERASGELSLAHYRVLAAIDAGSERASGIARRLAIGKPTVSAAVDALVQRGLLVRTEVAGDQRAAALHLTSAGEAVVTRVESDMIQRIEDLCARTPDGPRLMESLIWLGAAIDAVQAERASERASERRNS